MVSRVGGAARPPGMSRSQTEGLGTERIVFQRLPFPVHAHAHNHAVGALVPYLGPIYCHPQRGPQYCVPRMKSDDKWISTREQSERNGVAVGRI